MIMIAPLQKVTTGRVHNNAQNHGNAEVPECAKEADGVPALTDVKDLHFQPKLQDSQTHTESAPRDAWTFKYLKINTIYYLYFLYMKDK